MFPVFIIEGKTKERASKIHSSSRPSFVRQEFQNRKKTKDISLEGNGCRRRRRPDIFTEPLLSYSWLIHFVASTPDQLHTDTEWKNIIVIALRPSIRPYMGRGRNKAYICAFHLFLSSRRQNEMALGIYVKQQRSLDT